MNPVWKAVGAAVAVLLLLPLGAYAVGTLSASSREPEPRDIQITEAPPEPSSGQSTDRSTGEAPTPAPSGGRPDDTDDGVRVVTPPPAPVEDWPRGGDQRAGHAGDDGSGSGHGWGDDDQDDDADRDGDDDGDDGDD
jgi:hypothetical protein